MYFITIFCYSGGLFKSILYINFIFFFLRKKKKKINKYYLFFFLIFLKKIKIMLTLKKLNISK
jgi:hypothetical protein